MASPLFRLVLAGFALSSAGCGLVLGPGGGGGGEGDGGPRGNPPAALEIPMTVHVWSGDGPPQLVSNAIPFAPGALLDPALVRVFDPEGVEVPIRVRVLTRWHDDQSVRALLLQFDAPVPGGGSADYRVRTGAARGTGELDPIEVEWNVPARLATFSAEYLSRSLIAWEQKPLGQSGYPEWDTKQLDEYADAIGTVGTEDCVRYDHYYDAISTTFQLYVRTGEPLYLANAHRWAIHHRSDQIHLDGPDVGHGICGASYVTNTRYTFPQGLALDWAMFGDPESLRVSALVADNFYMPHDDGWYYEAPDSRGFWTEREAAFSLIGLIAHYEATLDTRYLDTVRARIHSLHRMQADNGNRAWVHNVRDHDPSEGCPETAFGSSPWMSGLLLEAFVTYHKLTQDPVARESIFWALDDLRARYLATTGAHVGESFIYLGCTSVYTAGNPDLDNLIAHAYAYGYRLSGYTRTELRDLGRALFETAVQDGFAGAHKQYDQQFRSSGHFVADIDPEWSPP